MTNSYLCARTCILGMILLVPITSQYGKKSIVFLLDAPRAYTDYNSNYFRIIPEGYNINQITHGTNADPDLISVDKVIQTIIKFQNYSK